MGIRVELFRDAAESQGRDRFSCRVELWDLLLDLGETFGWHPAGTTYLVPPTLKVATPARQNYQAGSVLDYKRVETSDAIAWAGALEGARRSPHFLSIVATRFAAVADGASEASVLSLIDEFIQYVYGGAFTFAALAPADARRPA